MTKKKLTEQRRHVMMSVKITVSLLHATKKQAS